MVHVGCDLLAVQRAQLFHRARRHGVQRAGPAVRDRLRGIPGARDHRADAVLHQDPAQRELRHRRAARHQSADLFDGLEREVVRDAGTPAHGVLRINVFADAAHLLIEGAIVAFARVYPDVRLTVVVEDRPIDIVEEGYDAGVRYGHYVPEDMVAVPLSGPQRWVVAAAPAYLAKYGEPAHPDDLAQHRCLQLLLGDNSAYKWEFDIDGERRRIRVPGPITINDTATTIAVAKSGAGLAYLLEARIADELAEGSLRIVLDAFAARGEPFHMYYSSRRHSHPALRALVNIIRARQSLPPVG